MFFKMTLIFGAFFSTLHLEHSFAAKWKLLFMKQMVNLVPLPMRTNKNCFSVLQVMESWAGPGNKAGKCLFPK